MTAREEQTAGVFCCCELFLTCRLHVIFLDHVGEHSADNFCPST